MTITEATHTQQLIGITMEARNELRITKGTDLYSYLLCEQLRGNLIYLADRSRAAMRDCPTAYLAEWTGDAIRRAWPKPADWEKDIHGKTL